jgi:hypothetical protein
MTLEEIIKRAFPCSLNCEKDLVDPELSPYPEHWPDCDAEHREQARRAVREALELAVHEIVCEATDPCQFHDADIIRDLAATLESKP